MLNVTDMNSNGIAVAGSILVDEINNVLSYPSAGELEQIISVSKAVGGCVPNVAIDLKKLSPNLPVFAMGKISDDENGKFVISTLKGNGINTDAVTVIKGERTSFTRVISVSGGQRTFFTYPGTSSLLGLEDISFEYFKPKILHLGYFLLLQKIDAGDGLKVLKKAKDLCIETSIDLVSENSDRYGLILPCLPYVDYLIINELEAGRLTNIKPDLINIPMIAEKLKKMGVQKKVIIHFKEGSLCCSDNGLVYLASMKLPKDYIKGTTGAGDAFCAGALLGIYKGLSDTEILDLGTCTATAALGTYDAVSGVETENSVIKLCKEFERNQLCL